MTPNMEGPFMGNASDNLDMAYDLFGQSAMGFSTMGPVFDQSFTTQEDFDYSQFFNNQQFTFEFEPDGAQTINLPLPSNDFQGYYDEPDEVPCQALNASNPLKRSLDADEHSINDDDDDHPAAADDDDSSSKKPKPKRLKARKNGFPCTHCTRTFDRAADLNKHEHRAHATDAEKPCPCSRCDKRFLYPKDVVRHNRQIHGVFDQLLQHMSATTGARPALLQQDADGKSSFMTLSTALVFSRSIVMLKGRLRLRRKSSVDSMASPVSPASSRHRFVMLTTDKRNFRLLDVAEVGTYDALLQAMRDELGLSPQHGLVVHRHYLGCDFDLPLTAQQTEAMLAKDADAHGTIKLYLTVIKPESREA